jgi:hypothetical protein
MAKNIEALLQEYKSCNDQVSRLDTIVWHTASVIFPISLAGLAYFGVFSNYSRYQLIITIAVAIGSIVMQLMWLLVYRQWHCYQAIAFYRMREIEVELGLLHYRYSYYMRESKDVRSKMFNSIIEKKEKDKFETFINYMSSLPRFRIRARKAFTIIAIVLMSSWVGLIIILCCRLTSGSS